MTREPGDKLIPKLIPVIRDAIVATKKGLAGHERDVRAAATQKVIDAAGLEIADLYRPIVDKLLAADTGSLSAETRQFLEDAKSGEHQLKAFAGLLMGPVSGALGTLITNELAPLVYAIVGANPSIIVDPQTAANAAAQGAVSYGDGADIAHQQGFNAVNFGAMYKVAQQAPDINSLQQLVNRGEMTQADAEYWIHRAAFDPNIIPLMLGLRHQLLSPADAALAVLRTTMTEQDGIAVSEKQGLSADDFRILIDNTGEPPGVMDMLAMYRRGIIDRARLEKGIRYSRVRDDWIPFIEQYRYQPMTTADAIDATVQGHLTEAQARAIADQNGLEPSAFDPMRQTAGEPLAKQELLRLYRRGVIDRATVVQGLKESRLKDKYINDAIELAVEIPPLFTIRAMLTAGTITDAQAAQLLKEGGYQDFVIKAIIAAAHKGKTAHVKVVTEGMLSALYQEQAITAAQFREQLKSLGYTDAEAAQIQEIDDWRIAKANRDNAITHLRSQYVGRKINSAKVQDELDKLHVPSDMRDKLIADWNLEISATVRLLTPAQVADAWSLTLIDTPTALGMLVNLGYTGPDAVLVLEIKAKGPLPPAGG